MRIVFMGTSDFAVPCLKILPPSHTVAGVITQPDRPKGRGMKLQPTPVKAAALELGLEVYQPERVKSPETLELLKTLAPDCIVVVSYGQILPKAVLELPPYGCVNVHASLLPKYRGAAPIHRAILEGERVSGVTTMYMDTELDTGDMIFKTEVPIPETLSVGELHDQLAEAGAGLLKRTLEALEAGNAPRTPQDPEAACYAPMIGRDLSTVDWSADAKAICDRIRGLDPWPAAQTALEGNVLKLFRPERVAGVTGKAPGTVLSCGPEGLLVAAGEDAVRICEIQGAGAKRMPVAAYILGRPIPVGSRLGG